MAQLASHASCKTWPAKPRGMRDYILAAYYIDYFRYFFENDDILADLWILERKDLKKNIIYPLQVKQVGR